MFVNIDFSENLSIPVKFKPQSLHWTHKQVIVHSGITKACSEKSYHVHLSDDKKNDQFFVHLALTNMIINAKAPDHSYIVIESNNCKVQYKSSGHFWSIQELANKYAVPIIRVFSIAEHSSCELFSQNLLEVEQLKKMNLRSAFANRRIPWRRCY